VLLRIKHFKKLLTYYADKKIKKIPGGVMAEIVPVDP
jgi:hypothetical protein